VVDERFLVTGGTGCIGAWVVRQLVRAEVPVTVLSTRGRLDRLALLLSAEEVEQLDVVAADITDLASIEPVARERGTTRIIHLAALQLPFCAADPIAGARANVQGTVAMFELARRLEIGRLVYASSAAVYGPRSLYATEVVSADAELHPTSHYGVFKVAYEQDARVWFDTAGVSSVGLRPHSVYGPGRDQGTTSKPTLAMIAAAAGRPFEIDFGGRYQFQYAQDAAEWFVAAARSDLVGAHVFSLPGPLIDVEQIVRTINEVMPASVGTISHTQRVLPFPSGFDGQPLEDALGARPPTSLHDGVRATIAAYESALADGRLDATYLDRVLAGA
jgi:UDP-glucuronate 4-epimerase